MKPLKHWAKRLRAVFRKDAMESDLDREMELHIELETEKNARAGMTLEEARRQAHISFGGVERYKQQHREARSLDWLGGMSLDFKLGVRMLRKHPALSVVSGLGMAVAIAIGSASFTLVRTALTDWLPEDDAHRIVKLENVDLEQGAATWKMTLHDLSSWRRGLSGVGEMGAYRALSRNIVFPNGGIERDLVIEMAASAFRAVRGAPLMGRMLEDADERRDAPPVTVIGYSVWRDRFQSDPRVVGKTVSFSGTPYTVVGVMREGFKFPYGERIWTPLTARAEDYPNWADAPDVQVVARMSPESSLEGVQAQLDALGATLAAEQPETHEHIRARVLPFARRLSPAGRWVIFGVQVMMGLIMLIIGINVAILVYARTANRIGEIAVRTALGGSRARVVGQLFSEALVLSSLASVAGLAAGQYGVNAFKDYLRFALLRPSGVRMTRYGEQPYWYAFRLDATTIGYVAGLALLAAVIVGVLPALKATGRRVQATLQRVTSSGSGLLLGRSWTALIVTQVAVAVWLLPFALSNLTSVLQRDGDAAEFRTSEFLTTVLELERKDLGTPAAESEQEFGARYRDLASEVVRRLQSDPKVAQVVRTNGPPVAFGSMVLVELEGSAPGRPAAVRPRVYTAAAVLASTMLPLPRNAVASARVDESFFSTFGVPILTGRDFNVRDMNPQATAVIVNQRFAQDVLGGNNPLGRRIKVRPNRPAEPGVEIPWREIVGVVPDFPSAYGVIGPRATVYQPLLGLGVHTGASPLSDFPVLLNLRIASDSPEAFAGRLREIALSVDPGLSFPLVYRLDEEIEKNGAGIRLLSLVLTLLPVSALLLSAAGIAALMAFTVEKRRREIGIRLALGAGGRHLLASVLGRATLQIGSGVAVGLAFVTLQMWADNWLNLQGVRLLASVVGVVMLVGLASTLGPLRRGMRIQPTEALKGE